jgi:hypothetical protein
MSAPEHGSDPLEHTVALLVMLADTEANRSSRNIKVRRTITVATFQTL